MGPAETTGIVVVTVAIIQGLISLTKYIVDKSRTSSDNSEKKDQETLLHEIKDKIGTDCGLNEKQSSQLHALYDLLTQKDSEGMPLVYFPRQSYGEVQKEIADKLQRVSEMQGRMLGIIERLETRLEKRIDQDGG